MKHFPISYQINIWLRKWNLETWEYIKRDKEETYERQLIEKSFDNLILL